MGHKCSAPDCKQGYDNCSKDPTVSFHSFPLKNPIMMDKWLKALPRPSKKWKPSKYSRLCSLHFKGSDFVTESSDRSRQFGKALQLRYLKSDAVPSLWPKFSKKDSKSLKKPKKFEKSNKQAPEIELLTDLDSDVDKEDETERDQNSLEDTLVDLYMEISSKPLPHGFVLIKVPKIALVKMEHSDMKGLDVEVSLEIERNLSFKVFLKHVQLDTSVVVPEELRNGNKISSPTQLIDLATFLGSKDIYDLEILNCCCTGCRTGFSDWKMYDNSLERSKYSLHPFPNEERLKNAWLKAINKKDFVPTENSRICSRHFLETCFQHDPSKPRSSKCLKLKSNAVPTIFSQTSTTLSSPTAPVVSPDQRNTYSFTSNMDKLYKFVRSNQINSLEDIQNKLNPTSLPKNIIVIFKKEYVLFFALSVDLEVPGFRYGLKINQNLSYDIFSNDLLIPKREVSDISSTDSIKQMSHLENILEYLTIMCDEPPCRTSGIKRAIKILKSLPKEEGEFAAPEDHMDFTIQQLSLSLVLRRGRRYSSRMLAISMAWYKKSSLLYNDIFNSEIIYLPTIKNLKRLKTMIEASGESTDVNLDELTAKIVIASSKYSKLNENEDSPECFL